MKVGIIMGGISEEREISLLTGKEISENINRNKYDIKEIILDSKNEAVDKLTGVDFAFIALHGKFGEDGTIQSLLETMDIPYSGCSVLSSAICMDKNISKKLLRHDGILTPDWIIIDRNSMINYDEIERIGYPMIVKPNSGGSSIGVFVVYAKEELEHSIYECFKHDNEVIVEKFINGIEITCPMLNGELLPILSIKSDNKFFDYVCKYTKGKAKEEVIELPYDILNKVISSAKCCWKTLKCRVYARIDMIINSSEPYVLEINTLPGMTENSLLPKSAAAAGINYTELLDKIIEYSLTTIRKVNPPSSISGGNYLNVQTSVEVKSPSEVVNNSIEDDALKEEDNRY